MKSRRTWMSGTWVLQRPVGPTELAHFYISYARRERYCCDMLQQLLCRTRRYWFTLRSILDSFIRGLSNRGPLATDAFLQSITAWDVEATLLAHGETWKSYTQLPPFDDSLLDPIDRADRLLLQDTSYDPLELNETLTRVSTLNVRQKEAYDRVLESVSVLDPVFSHGQFYGACLLPSHDFVKYQNLCPKSGKS